MTRANRFNEKVAVAVTNGTATMACFYVFLAIALISAPQAIGSHNPVVMVNWLSSNLIQLILLPVLAYGQKVASTKHDATDASLDELHSKQDRLHEHLGVDD